MPITEIPTKTDGSIGRVKSDASVTTVSQLISLLGSGNLDHLIPAAEFERIKDAVIEVFETIGLSDGSTVGSIFETLASIWQTLPDGSQAAPALAFALDPDTGIFSDGANKLAFSAGGTKRLTLIASSLASTVPFAGPDGSAVTPAIGFSTSPGNGMFLLGADQVGLAAGGSNRALIDAAGLSVVSGQLSILDGSAVLPGLRIGAAPDTGIYGVDADTIGITASGVEVARATAPAGADPQLLVVDGDAGDPAVGFASDDDTGIYRVGANQVGVSTGGTLRAQIDSAGLTITGSGVLSAPVGSAAAPSITVSQADTGLYDGGADILAIAAGGLQVAQFKAPAGALPQLLMAAGSAAKPAFAFTAEDNMGVYRASAGTLSVAIGGSEQYRFQSGNVIFPLSGTGVAAGASNSSLLCRGLVSTGSQEAVKITNLVDFTGGAGTTQSGAAIRSTVNQTNTAAFTDLLIARTQTAAGSGAQRLIDAQVGGTSRFAVDSGGTIASAHFVEKTADETVVSSTTLQNDDHLTATLIAGGRYHFRFIVFINTESGTPGIKLALGGTATVTSMKALLTMYSAGAVNLANARFTLLDGSDVLGFGLGAGTHCAIIEGSIEVNAAGTLVLTWAQDTSSADDTTVQRNSTLEVRRCA